MYIHTHTWKCPLTLFQLFTTLRSCEFWLISQKTVKLKVYLLGNFAKRKKLQFLISQTWCLLYKSIKWDMHELFRRLKREAYGERKSGVDSESSDFLRRPKIFGLAYIFHLHHLEIFWVASKFSRWCRWIKLSLRKF